MSAETPNVFDLMRLIRSSDLDPAAKILLLEIMDRASNGKGVCTASAATLARDTKISERHVVRLLGDLAAGGWVVVQRSGGSPNSPRRRITLSSRVSLCKPPTSTPTSSQSSEPTEPTSTPTSSQTYSDTKSELLRHDVRQTSSSTSEDSTSVDGADGNPSCRTGGGGSDETPGSIDKAKVIDLASRCPHLKATGASEKLAGRGDLSKLIDGDWRSLALAVVKTQVGRETGEINVIRQPVAYLVRVAKSIRDGEDPGPKVRRRLDALLSGDDAESPDGGRDRIREMHVDRVMNPASLTAALRKSWMDYAEKGVSIYDIECSILYDMRITDDEYRLAEWQRAQRRSIADRLFASMRPPSSIDCYDDSELETDYAKGA